MYKYWLPEHTVTKYVFNKILCCLSKKNDWLNILNMYMCYGKKWNDPKTVSTLFHTA